MNSYDKSTSNKISADQLAPHSVESEEAVLGSILISPDSLFEVMGFLSADDFFIVRHQWIYAAILALHKVVMPIDYTTVMQRLEETSKLAEIGGAAYLLGLTTKTPSALNIEGYGRIVKRMSLRRKLLDAASQIARIAHSDETDDAKIKSKVQQTISACISSNGDGQIKGAKELGLSNSNYVQNASQMGVQGIETYQTDLDKMLVVLRAGELITVAARPSMGKTSWLLSVIAQNCRHGIPIGLLSLEMSDFQVTNRLIAALSRIPYKQLESGDLSSEEWARYWAAVSEFSQWPLFVDDTPAVTGLDAYAKIGRMVLEHGAQAVFLDYVQLMRGENENGKNRAQEISFITQQLKLAAREYNVPVVIAAQLNREVEQRTNKRGQLSDLKDSGSIEQDSDTVMFLYRDAYYNPTSTVGNVTEIHVAKQRNGPTGKVEVIFLADRMEFVNAARTHIDLDNLPDDLPGIPASTPVAIRLSDNGHGRKVHGQNDDL